MTGDLVAVVAVVAAGEQLTGVGHCRRAVDRRVLKVRVLLRHRDRRRRISVLVVRAAEVPVDGQARMVAVDLAGLSQEAAAGVAGMTTALDVLAI
jgi:hypothetical protein